MGAGSFPHVGFDITKVYTALGPSTTGASVGVGAQAPQLGEVYHDEATGSIYKFVKNTHSSAVVVGDVGVYDVSGGLWTSVKQTVTAALNLLAGAWCGAAAAAGYGWIQVRGVGSVKVDGTGAALGDSMKGVNAAANVIKDAATGTEATYDRHIVNLDATAGTSVRSAYIDCF